MMCVRGGKLTCIDRIGNNGKERGRGKEFYKNKKRIFFNSFEHRGKSHHLATDMHNQ